MTQDNFVLSFLVLPVQIIVSLAINGLSSGALQCNHCHTPLICNLPTSRPLLYFYMCSCATWPSPIIQVVFHIPPPCRLRFFENGSWAFYLTDLIFEIRDDIAFGINLQRSDFALQ